MGSISVSGIRAIVTDIEGTTTPVSFVTRILFPFAKDRLSAFLQQHEDDPEIRGIIATAGQVAGNPALSISAAIALFTDWIDADRKETSLKQLQGLIWREGYESGLLNGEIYEDVAAVLRHWHESGLALAIYSSGSVDAQKLLFSTTSAGDLTPLFKQYFDTRIGGKNETGSYARIAQTLNQATESILFLSDSERELEAAAGAGYRVIRLDRDGGAESRWPIACRFDEIHAV